MKTDICIDNTLKSREFVYIFLVYSNSKRSEGKKTNSEYRVIYTWSHCQHQQSNPDFLFLGQGMVFPFSCATAACYSTAGWYSWWKHLDTRLICFYKYSNDLGVQMTFICVCHCNPPYCFLLNSLCVVCYIAFSNMLTHREDL